MAAAQECFERALAAAPEDGCLQHSVAALAEAGTMNAREHAQMAAHLVDNLRSIAPRLTGQPVEPMPLEPCPVP